MTISSSNHESNLAYRIPKFDKAHMRSEHKTLIKKGYRWPWVRVPTDMNCVGLKMLVRDVHGVAAFGVYILLVEAAANMHIRGVLADDRGGITLRRLSMLINVPLDVLGKSIELLIDPEIGWIDQVEIRVADGQPEIKSDRRLDQNKPSSDLIETQNRLEIKTICHSEPSLIDLDEEENEDEDEEVEEEKDEDEERCASEYRPRTRSGGRQLWLVQCSRIGPGPDSSQWRSDKTSAERLFDDVIWPDGIEHDTGLVRLNSAIGSAGRAASVKPKPMAWLTTTIKSTLGEGVSA